MTNVYDNAGHLERLGALARENEDLKRRLAELEKQQPVNERLVEALLYWRDECRGAEPSLSVFARMADEALAAWLCRVEGADNG